MDLKGNVFKYDPKNVGGSDIQKMLEELMMNRPSPTTRQLKVFVSADTQEFLQAVSDGDNEKVERMSREAHERMMAAHNRRMPQWISKYGKEAYDFIDGIMSAKDKTLWLAHQEGDHITLHSWTDQETCTDDYCDDYYDVSFHKGEFHYRWFCCGGYAGTETKEEGITFERVMELISANK